MGLCGGTDVEEMVLQLVGATGDEFNCSIAESKAGIVECRDITSHNQDQKADTNYFKSVGWSQDGTCLFTNSADDTIRTFVVPPDLLTARASPHILQPYTAHQNPEPVYTVTPFPGFTLSLPETTLLVTTPRDHPIRLTNVLDPAGSVLASYPLVSPTTEAFQTPASLVFTSSGDHFLAGTSCLISLFDVERSGEGPITRLPTIPSKRHKMKGGGVGIRGIVSALALQPTSGDGDTGAMLAAATWTRWVGLYDAQGMGGTVATWTIADAADSEAGIGGAGVSQVTWSHCGRYLIVTERMSSGVLIYDVRVSGRLLAWCQGRDAQTNQRMVVDLFPHVEGATSELWAGGLNGDVTMWENIGHAEGPLEPSRRQTTHGSSVNGVSIHSSGTVMATSSGERRETTLRYTLDDTDDDDDNSINQQHDQQDNSIRLWQVS